jgi:outer membrane protein TolC
MNRRRIAAAALLLLAAECLGAENAALPGLTLREAVEKALANSADLAASRSNAAEGKASARLAADRFHPEAFLTTTPGYTTGIPSAIAGRVPSVAGVEVRSTLFDSGARSEALEASARAAGLEAELENATLEAVQSAVLAYSRCFAGARIVEAAREKLGAREKLRVRAEALAREGRIRELDAERAVLFEERARQEAAQAEADLETDRLELARLTGLDGSSSFALTDDPAQAAVWPLPSNRWEAAREKDPFLRALSRQVEQLRQSSRLASRIFQPVVEAQAQYQRLARFNNYDQYYSKFKADDVSIGISVVIPLWTGGRSKDLEARQKAKLERAQAQLRAAESNLSVLLRRLELASDRAEARLILSRRALDLSEKEFAASEALAREGRGPADGQESSRIELSEARSELARSSVEAVSARLRLASLCGALSAAVPEGAPKAVR